MQRWCNFLGGFSKQSGAVKPGSRFPPFISITAGIAQNLNIAIKKIGDGNSLNGVKRFDALMRWFFIRILMEVNHKNVVQPRLRRLCLQLQFR